MKRKGLFHQWCIGAILGILVLGCSDRNAPRNDNGAGLPGNGQREESDAGDGNHGDDDTRSEQTDRSN